MAKLAGAFRGDLIGIKIDGFVKSLFTGHCEERSGCEAEPKQTRSLSFRTKKYDT